MSQYRAIIDSYCWNVNLDVDGVFTGFFIYMPVVLRLGLGGYALYSKDLYLQILSSSYWLALLLNTLLQSIFLEQHPNPSCAFGLASPAWECQVIGHFLILFVLWHRRYWHIPLSAIIVIRTLVLAVVVPVVFVVSGNHTIKQVLLGLGFGAATGLFMVHAMLFFWLDRLDIICSTHVLRNWLGYRSAVTLFYANQSHQQRQSRSAEDVMITSPFFGINGGSFVMNSDEDGEDDTLLLQSNMNNNSKDSRKAAKSLRRRHARVHKILSLVA
jgi:hypothetical protein